MVYTMVHSVRDLIYAFINDDVGGIITSLCVMGACIALFRIFRRGAGG